MPYRLNTERLRTTAARLGDTSDYKIIKRTGIAFATMSRLVNGHVEPSIRHLDLLANTYGLRIEDLYIEVPDAEGAAA